jgi:rod shape-determining protein MreD
MRFFFLLALIAHIFGSNWIPSFHLMYFAPFLALSFMRKDLQKSLWIASFCGLIVDLSSSGARFGLYAFTYVITALLTYRANIRLYEESFFSLPLYTFLISSAWSLLSFLFFFGYYPPDPSAFFSNFILMPFLDSLYAFFFFSCPLLIYSMQKRKRLS